MQSSKEHIIALAAAVLVDESIPDSGLNHSKTLWSFQVGVDGGVTFLFTRHSFSQVAEKWIQYTVKQKSPAVSGYSCIYVYGIPPETGDPAGCRAALSGALNALAAKEPKLRVAIEWTPTGPYV